ALSGTVPSRPCQAQSHLRLVRHCPIYALSGTPTYSFSRLRTLINSFPFFFLIFSPIYALSGSAPSTPCQALPHRCLVRHTNLILLNLNNFPSFLISGLSPTLGLFFLGGRHL
ncbi:hypothetical protein ATANTOWER_029458, partial [Ataeniobius toweri]|nr:hypothetical protein [Ataeniobius toweri]